MVSRVSWKDVQKPEWSPEKKKRWCGGQLLKEKYTVLEQESKDAKEKSSRQILRTSPWGGGGGGQNRRSVLKRKGNVVEVQT